MKEAPTISVIVPHYNDLAGLDLCLSKLEAQTFPRDAFEIVVADNGSPQGEAAVEQVISGRARLVTVRERGAGPARNGAVKHARGKILAFIDSDCQAEPEWLEQGMRALDHFDYVGGQVTVLVGDPEKMTGTEAFERVFAFDFKTYITRKGFTGSGNMFCPKAVFERVGGFRTVVSEDTEWCARAAAAGFTLGYCEGAIVGHPARRTWAELKGKWHRLGRESHAFITEQPIGNVRWLIRTLVLPASAVIHTPKVLVSPKLNTASQRVKALFILYRLRLWRFWDAIALIGIRGR